MTPPDRPSAGGPPILPVPPEIEVVVEDLAFIEVEAIARPVTAELMAPTALLRRLEVAGGETLRARSGSRTSRWAWVPPS